MSTATSGPLTRQHGLSLDAARRAASELGASRRAATETVLLADSAGRILAQSVHALTDLPSVSTSAMDGWVVAGAPPWSVGPPIVAGDAPDPSPLASGTARPMATGGPIPPGALAVLRSERGRLVGGLLEPERLDDVTPGRHLRSRGEECEAGEELVPAGVVLTAPRIALLAVAGHDDVEVARVPTVDLLLLGSEVIETGLPGVGLVRDAYSPQLPALLASIGARVSASRRVEDRLETTIDRLRATTGDLVISTGGTAGGATDHIRSALGEVGARIVVDGLDVRPGHPTIVAVLPDGRPMLCLPGNPLAAMIVLAAIGVPILDGMLGRDPRPEGQVVTAGSFANPSRGVRLTAYRATTAGAEPTFRQGSGMLRGLASSDGIAIVPAGGAAAGEMLRTLPTPW